MKKTMKIILIILVAAAVIAAGVTFVVDRSARKHPPVVRYSWSYGGDMSGNSSSMYIEKRGDKAIVVKTYREWYDADPVVREYYVSADCFSSITETFDKYRIYRFDKLREKKYHALDAGSTYYIFSYEGGGTLSFDDDQDIPGKGYDGLRAINDIIEAAINSGEKLPGLVLSSEGGDYSPWTPGEGQIGLHVFEYSEGALMYKFANETENDVEVSSSTKVFRLEGDERTEIYSDEPCTRTIYSIYYNDPVTVNTGRLEPGRYVLSFGEYEEEFEIGQ